MRRLEVLSAAFGSTFAVSRLRVVFADILQVIVQ